MRRRLTRLAIGAGCAALLLAAAWAATRARPVPALVVLPVASALPALAFVPPAPGSYTLDRIMRAPDGAVLDSDGSARRLAEYTTGKLTLFSFIYTYCTDARGCPLAYETLHSLRQSIEQDPALRERVRFVSMSFDPRNDPPETMRLYGDGELRRKGGLSWHFLTTRSGAELAPLLDGFGQDVSVASEQPEGARVPVLSHMLKVYLIDTAGDVREIYSTSFLQPAILLNDIKTLLQEPGASTPVAKAPALGLPPLPTSGPAPSPQEVALGRKLFMDRRLSSNGTMSCAMCHIPEQGFTATELGTALGIEGRTLRRNAPTLLNVAYVGQLFHDGRASKLENQAWDPLLHPVEMGNPDSATVLAKLGGLPDYAGRFEAVFKAPPDRDNVGRALASYQRSLVSGNAPFDRWRYGGEQAALNAREKAGFAVFAGKGRCIACHTVGERHALFTDARFHNTGVGASQERKARSHRVTLAPGVVIDVADKALANVSEPLAADEGRFEVTGQQADRWSYRTPSLRNVALTAPYMHDGSLPTLEAVIDYYQKGGVANPGRDRLIAPLALDAKEREHLLAFLRSLTGDNVAALARDARAP